MFDTRGLMNWHIALISKFSILERIWTFRVIFILGPEFSHDDWFSVKHTLGFDFPNVSIIWFLMRTHTQIRNPDNTASFTNMV